jgi:hypothetical protein
VKLLVEKLEIVFMDNNGKFYPLDEVSSVELASEFEKISKEIAKKLQSARASYTMSGSFLLSARKPLVE